jgi:hypothetical protein
MKLHVLSYDLFSLVRQPDEVARLSMLVARADVDPRLTTRDEFALAPQLCFLKPLLIFERSMSWRAARSVFQPMFSARPF